MTTRYHRSNDMDIDETPYVVTPARHKAEAMDIDQQTPPLYKKTNKPAGNSTGNTANASSKEFLQYTPSRQPLRDIHPSVLMDDRPAALMQRSAPGKESKEISSSLVLHQVPHAAKQPQRSKGKSKIDLSESRSDVENEGREKGQPTRPEQDRQTPHSANKQHLIYHNHNYHPPTNQEHLFHNTWSHPHMPHTLLAYVRLIFNLTLAMLCLAILFSFVRTIFKDVSDKLHVYSQEAREEIYACSQNYMQAFCGTSSVIPFSAQFCDGWKACMERDPTVIGRAKVGAETFAEVVNSFVDGISWKTMAFLLAVLALFLFATNSAIHQTMQQPQQTSLQDQRAFYGLPSPQPYHSPYASQPQSKGMDGISIPQVATTLDSNISNPSRRRWYSIL